MNFENTKQFKKGKLGEEIVRNYLELKGFICYTPVTRNKAHCFDMLIIKNKLETIALDVKTKSRLNKYNATGVDYKSYLEYKKWSNYTNLPFYLFFVDDRSGEVHYNNLENLNETNGFKISNDKIIVWEINQMQFLFNINDKNILNQLQQYDTRTYTYNPDVEIEYN